jgi:hypothetical protein
MFLVDAALNAAADAVADLADFLSVHSAFSTSGANEDTGGSYAREAATWNAASSLQATLNGDVDITVNAGTWKYVGFQSLATGGTFYGMFPIGSTGFKKVYAIASTDTIHSEAHGFSDGDIVVFFGDALPGGITQGTEYTVDNAATDTFTLDDGGAVTITDEGFGVVSKLVAEVFGSSGVLRVNGTTSLISAGGLRT